MLSYSYIIIYDCRNTIILFRNKKMKKIEKKIKTGKVDINEDDPFELFIASTNIRYAYYHETHKILGLLSLTQYIVE